jgi:hypothetical protein
MNCSPARAKNSVIELTPSEIDHEAGRTVIGNGGLELYQSLWQEPPVGDA